MMRIGPMTIGTNGVRQAVEGRGARDDVHRIPALRLNDRGDLPVANQRVTGERQFVDRAHHEPVPRIEIRRTVLAGDVIAVLNREAATN